MSSSEIALSVCGLSKSYNIAHQNRQKHNTLAEAILARARSPFRRMSKETFWALKDLTFDVRKGDVVGVVGRNGAGKSTLLKILSQITEPTAGRIELFGRVGSLLEVGTGFHPELTGRENIFLNGAILGMTRAEVRKHFDAIVDFAGVSDFLDTPVKRYSSGMYVRLAFAVAAHLETDILLVDEVLAVGDVQFQKKCISKMGAVAAEGRTVFFVSHNISLLLALCTSGIYLERGLLVPTATFAECVQRYNGVAVVSGGDWTGAAGDSRVRITRAAVRGEKIDGVFQREDNFTVEIEYEILDSEVPEMVLGVEVYDHKNQFLCHSFLTETLAGTALNRAKAQGRHRAAVRIGANLFAEGHYFIKFDLGLHNRRRLVLDDILLHFSVAVDRFNGFSNGSFKANTLVPPWEWSWQPVLNNQTANSETARNAI